jgi:pimeloyl-ACP methyl ester carboxylesterase
MTVVFVHGMFVTPACWAKWEALYRARGWRTHAPAWPEHELAPAVQREKHPNVALAKLTLDDVVESHRAMIRSLDAPPVVIGHSMGGLIAQILLSEGLAAAGVAIDSAPPKGVITLKWSFLKSSWGSISPFASVDEPIFMDENLWSYGFTNTLSPAEQRRSWEDHAVPESRRVGKGPTTDIAKIDFARARPPLLLIAGGADRTIPPELNRKNFARYAGPSITEYKEFEGRDHYSVIGGEGWREVAEHAFAWIDAHVPS